MEVLVLQEIEELNKREGSFYIFLMQMIMFHKIGFLH